MKKILLLLFLLPLGLWGNDVVLQRVKLILDDVPYIWENEDTYPQLEGQGLYHPAAMLSLLNLRPQDELSLPQLEKRVAQARYRLEQSGWFYNVQILLIPSRRHENRYTLSIQLQSGFRHRFMGDAIWAGWGMDNLWGRGDSLFLRAGYNRADLRYRYYLKPGSPWSLNFFGGYESSLPGEDLYQLLFHQEELSYNLSPSMKISLGYLHAAPLAENTYLQAGAQELLLSLDYETSPTDSQDPRFDLTADVYFPVSAMGKSVEYGRAALEGGLTFPMGTILHRTEIALLHSGEAVDSYFQRELIRGYLRSGYEEGEGRSHNVQSLNMDLALKVDGRRITVYPFLLADVALLQHGVEEALGAGVHLFFKAPVFVDMMLFAGSDLQGRWTAQFMVDLGEPY